MSSFLNLTALRSWAQRGSSLPTHTKNLWKTSKVACFVSGAIGMGAFLTVSNGLYQRSSVASVALSIKNGAIEKALPFLNSTAFPFFKEPPFNLGARLWTALYKDGALTAAGGSVVTLAVLGISFILSRRVPSKRDEALSKPVNEPLESQSALAAKEAAKEQELTLIRQELATANGIITGIKGREGNYHAEIEKYQHALEAAREELAAKDQELAEVQRELKTVQETLTVREDSLEVARQDFAELTKKLSAATSSIEEGDGRD